MRREVGRGVVDPLAEVADRVDAAVRRGVDLDEVHRPALADRDARRAGVARVAVLEVRAVDGLGEDPGQRRLARPARPDEEDRVRDPVRSGRRSGASRRPPPARRPGRTSAPASGGRSPGAPGAASGRRSRGRLSCLVRARAREPFLVVAVHPLSTDRHPGPPQKAARIRPFRGTRRASLSAASFRT